MAHGIDLWYGHKNGVSILMGIQEVVSVGKLNWTSPYNKNNAHTLIGVQDIIFHYCKDGDLLPYAYAQKPTIIDVGLSNSYKFPTLTFGMSTMIV